MQYMCTHRWHMNILDMDDVVCAATEVSVTLEVLLHEGYHRFDVPRSGVALEL